MSGPKYDVHPDPFPQVRGDGWQNSLMGYGTWRDKMMAGSHVISARINDAELSSLFYTNDLAAKLVEKRPEEAFRRGYKLTSKTNQAMAQELQEAGAALELDSKYQEGKIWGRLYGGALLIIGAEQGQPWQPLNVAAVREVRFLNVVDRRYITVEKYYADPMAPNFGKPEIYRVYGINGFATLVHESRCIRFEGTQYVDYLKRQELAGWSYSVLQRAYDVMRDFATAFQSAGILCADASQAVFKLKGLFQMIASGEKEKFQARMQLVDMCRSALRAVLVDADGEDFERKATSFAGLPDMLDRFAMRLAATFDMPVTLLVGRSPAGMNATGDSDFQHWYDSVASEQKKDDSPRLKKIYAILAKGKLPKDFEVEWLPLAEPTDTEKADADLKKWQKWDIAVNRGILYPQEIAISEYGKTSNGEISIDEEQRQKSLKAEQELEANPPPPVVAPPADPNAPPKPPTPPQQPPQA